MVLFRLLRLVHRNRSLPWGITYEAALDLYPAGRRGRRWGLFGDRRTGGTGGTGRGGALAGIPLNWPPEGRPGRKAFGDFHWGALRSVGGEEDARTVRPYNSITDAGLGRGAF